jgi:Holliday junction resolvase RusA-like endonuclease
MTTVSFEAAVTQLTGLGWSREVAERQVREQLQGASPAATTRPEASPVRLPFRITIPWSLLISDNERHCGAMRQGKPIVMTKSVYTQAKNKIVEIATRAADAGVPLREPLSLVGRVFPPRATRVDPTNFAKLVQDALSCVVYSDDKWLYDVRWVRDVTDVDAPRAEIVIDRADRVSAGCAAGGATTTTEKSA